MMRQFFTNKKAVSPVIATVLMILVTMVGMTLLFGFVTYYSDSYRAGVGSQVMELLTVEDVWTNPPNDPYSSMHPVNFTIYNAGKIDSQITSIYVNGLALTTSTGEFNLKDATVEVGHHITLTLYRGSQNAWASGTYIFTIGTKTGSTFDVTYTIT